MCRCEAVRHCRWVDEVVPEAPWVIDGPFIEKVYVPVLSFLDSSRWSSFLLISGFLECDFPVVQDRLRSA